MNVVQLGLVFACVLCGPSLAAEPAKPNLIVIYTDDHGWADLGRSTSRRMSARRILTRSRPAESGPPTATSPRPNACRRAADCLLVSSRGGSTLIPTALRWTASTRRLPSPRGYKTPVTLPACPASGTSGRRNRSRGTASPTFTATKARGAKPGRTLISKATPFPARWCPVRSTTWRPTPPRLAPSSSGITTSRSSSTSPSARRILRWTRRRNTPRVSPVRCRNAAGRPWP